MMRKEILSGLLYQVSFVFLFSPSLSFYFGHFNSFSHKDHLICMKQTVQKNSKDKILTEKIFSHKNRKKAEKKFGGQTPVVKNG